jgi:hypothetical protein
MSLDNKITENHIAQGQQSEVSQNEMKNINSRLSNE